MVMNHLSSIMSAKLSENVRVPVIWKSSGNVANQFIYGVGNSQAMPRVERAYGAVQQSTMLGRQHSMTSVPRRISFHNVN